MSSPLLRERILRAAGEVVRRGGADFMEAVVDSVRTSSLRFASSRFHQGITETDVTVYIRVVADGRLGVSSTNSLDISVLKETLRDAINIARHQRKEPFGLKLPDARYGYSRIESFFVRTAEMTEREKVSALSRGFRKASKKGVSLSGILTTSSGELAVVNSSGTAAYHPYTAAYLSSVSAKGGVTGFDSAFSKDISNVDMEGVLEKSAGQCVSHKGGPRPIEPGPYRVLLEPPAVSELLNWLSYTGLGAKNFCEGTSFLCGRLGEKVTGDSVTIYDDGLARKGMAVPFDFEGVPKRRLAFIEEGVARAVAYDSFTSSMEGAETTGHASYPDDAEGPLPAHLFMESGAEDRAALLKNLDNGLVINSFHYVNGLLNPKETIMTGMTRHGTFFVKGGRIRYPVRPMRFTENILEAFSRIEALSSETMTMPGHSFPLSSVTAPYVLIDGFNFTP